MNSEIFYRKNGNVIIPLNTTTFRKDDRPDSINRRRLHINEEPKGPAIKSPLPRPHKCYINCMDTNKNTKMNSSRKYKLGPHDKGPTDNVTNEAAYTIENKERKSKKGGKRKTRKTRKKD